MPRFEFCLYDYSSPLYNAFDIKDHILLFAKNVTGFVASSHVSGELV